MNTMFACRSTKHIKIIYVINVRSTQLSMTSFLIVKRVNYCILEVDIVVQSIKELKLTDSM